MRNLLMILLVTLTNLGGQLLIKDAVSVIGSRSPHLAGIEWAAAVLQSPKIWLSIAIQALGFLAWVGVLSRMKLGPAFAVWGAFFYVLLALVSWWLYGEKLAPLQWGGILLVSMGVLMMSAAGQQA